MTINPWSDPKVREGDPQWEELPLDDDPPVRRLRVPGGWIYQVGKHPPIFIAET